MLYPELHVQLHVEGTTITLDEVIDHIRVSLQRQFPTESFNDICATLSAETVHYFVDENVELASLVCIAAHTAFVSITSS